jgi:general secretion pathway protein D
MEKKNYGRVLAKPKILVNDNEPGTISTQDTTYVQVTGSALPQQGTQVVQTSTSYQDYSAGINLQITPHISEGNLLRLDVALTRSDFAGEVGGEGPPDQVSSDITTVVTVPDESTIILGGMIKLNQSKGGSKVPLLGDIPVVGALFRGVSNSDIQKKLYIFVKAEIIRPSDVLAGSSDLERISERNQRAFEQHEAEFQNYQGLPGMAGRPMEPQRVLDAR